jgi:hypothetical protein
MAASSVDDLEAVRGFAVHLTATFSACAWRTSPSSTTQPWPPVTELWATNAPRGAARMGCIEAGWPVVMLGR